MVLTQFSVPLFAFGTALILNLLLTPFILHVSHKFNWFDHLDHRKIHTGEVPRLGGVGFFLSFISVVVLGSFILPEVTFTVQYLFLLLGFLVIHLLGLIDDFRNIPARFKLLGQMIAGAMVVLGGSILPGFTIFGFVIPFGILSIPLTVFWLISLSNSINLIDGVDGLAGGVSLIASLVFGIIHFWQGSSVGTIISFALAGALVAFLVFNKPVAKIFMGDSGSLFLGFVLGSVFFVGQSYDSLFSYSGIGLTMTILSVPILDLVAAIMRRVRKKRPIFSPDREHLHHKLLDFGFSIPKLLCIVYTWVVFAGVASLLWVYSFRTGILFPIGADFLLMLVWIGSITIFATIHYRNKLRKSGLGLGAQTQVVEPQKREAKE